MNLHPNQNPSDDSGAPSSSGDSLSLPGSSSSSSSTPQTRRKRGLSLRSQLFNKVLVSLNGSSSSASPPPAPAAPATPKELSPESDYGHLTLNTLGDVPPKYDNSYTKPPTINIDTVNDPVDSKSHSGFNIIHRNLSSSTSQLTATSSRSDSSVTNFITSDRKRKKRLPHNPFLASLHRLKNRILRVSDFDHTENGRIIPLTVSKDDINRDFNCDLYDRFFASLIDERSGEPYVNNLVTSSKYTVYSFLPKQLKAQFSKIANCYFMIVAIMQMIPTWSTTGQYTTIIPLMVFMSISIAREGFDDWKRHLQDKEENSKLTTVIKEDHELANFDTHSIATIMTETIPVVPGNVVPLTTFSSSSSSTDGPSDLGYTNHLAMKRYNLKEYKTKWKNIKVGDIVKVNENEWIPADIVLLRTSDLENQEAFVETMALDGETNLKPKSPHLELAHAYSTAPGIKNTKTLVTVEDPNIDLYNFEGLYELNGEIHSLGSDNIIYRGSILRNTSSVLGLVVFTGEETKIRMNNVKNPRTKAPKLQKNINYIVIFMVCVVVLLSAFSTMAQRLMYEDNRRIAWYLLDQDVGVAATLMGFIIMYNTLIPLSLYVTMEIIKVMQLCFLQYDLDMYHVETNTPCDAKTATILEELGQVSYIFSDKTGTLTDNKMIFRKFSICGVSWLHDLDLMLEEKKNPTKNFDFSSIMPSLPIEHDVRDSFHSALHYQPRNSTTEIARESVDSSQSHVTWKSSAQPKKIQNLSNSLQLLKYIQSHPQTLFSKKAKFFLLSIALCNTCLPRKKQPSNKAKSESNISLIVDEEEEVNEVEEEVTDENIQYQAASPDELALVQAARDLGFVVFNRKQNILTIKLYPNGFDQPPKYEEYEVLDVIEFSSARKRMSIIVRFPDKRICIFCKGADNIILQKLKNAELALQKAKQISLNSTDRKTMEADAVLQSKLSQEYENKKSLSSLRNSIGGSDLNQRMNSIDFNLLHREEDQMTSIANKARKSLHMGQAKRYSLDNEQYNPETEIPEGSNKDVSQIFPNDKLLVNEEFIIEKTLEHIEEFSTEGLRTLLYSFKWVDKKFYDNWSREYSDAKIALVDRNAKVEAVGEQIETNLELIGATAIEDKLQDGVSEAIEKLRRAGIKLWMLTGDKRETAINIGYSCRLIKDYSTVVVLSNDEGKESLMQMITSAGLEIKAGRVAHCVCVIDGASLTDIEDDPTLLSLFLELCIQTDSTICCRASPSQKANMVSRVRELKKNAVTLAIGDGANDIAMIQSADIGVGITGKEGLQAARSADYAIAQFRFLLKLLLVNGRYNYIRTSKFVLCTFYKELLFYLTQAVYQRNTLFSGSSMYESWSLSMFNTLFTSLPVICIGMFDKDLHPSTLLAIPELYAKGRLYQAFNLKVFVSWMFLAALQSVGISFLAYYLWGFTSLKDNDTLPLGTLVFGVLVIVINAKCELIEMQNRQWLAFAAFIISVGGYGLWNLLIMMLYRTKTALIFYVDYGLLIFGADQSWWAAFLVIFTVPMLLDILIKVFKFSLKPNDDEIFRLFERDIEMRRFFEENAIMELHQGWQFPRQSSSWKKSFVRCISFVGKKIGLKDETLLLKSINLQEEEAPGSSAYRKRAGTETRGNELPPSGEGQAIKSNDIDLDGYEILPSGAVVKIKPDDIFTRLGKRVRGKSVNDEDADAIIAERMSNLRKEEESLHKHR